MTMSFVASTGPSGDSSTGSKTTAKPTGTQDGDIVFWVWYLMGNHTVTAPTPPANFSLIGSTANTADHVAMYLYAKIASGDGASYAWTNNEAQPWNSAAFTYRSSSPAPALYVDASQTDKSSAGGTTEIAFSGITNNVAGTLIGFTVSDNGVASPAVPSGFTQRASQTSALDSSIFLIGDLNPSSVGATGTKTFTCASAIGAAVGRAGVLLNLAEPVAAMPHMIFGTDL